MRNGIPVTFRGAPFLFWLPARSSAMRRAPSTTRVAIELLIFILHAAACASSLARVFPGIATSFARRFAKVRIDASASASSGGSGGSGGGKRRSGNKNKSDNALCYVDGSASTDGGRRRSGIGVWYSYGHALNYASATTTRSTDNNVVEMLAVYAAVVRHGRDDDLTVCSDSRVCCKKLERLTTTPSATRAGEWLDSATLCVAFALSKRRGKTTIRKVRAHVGGNHTSNARADQLALIGSKAGEREEETCGFAPRCEETRNGASIAAARAACDGRVLRELARFLSGEEGFGNGCIDGNGTSEARRRAHEGVMADVRRADRSGAESLVKPTPFSDDCTVTDVLALDCEMVGVGECGMESMLAQVCVVNEHGNTVYLSYSRAYKNVTDYRTRVSGILPRHVDGSAPEFSKVRAEVSELIKGRIVVGHALENDFAALELHHPRELTRDTAKWRPLLKPPRFTRPRRLRHLARDFCSLRIQSGDDAHDPAEDALAALCVYRKFRDNWEAQLKAAAQGKRARDAVRNRVPSTSLDVDASNSDDEDGGVK